MQETWGPMDSDFKKAPTLASEVKHSTLGAKLGRKPGETAVADEVMHQKVDCGDAWDG